ncbi:M23 family metallopeptidase [bacterium]|nr:M23 family metallopeptidase [bacterium]
MSKLIWTAPVILMIFIGGCSSLQQRISQQIEYIIPKEEASPGEVLQIGYILPEEVKGGYVRFLNKKQSIFRRKDLGERTFTSFLPIPQINPGKYRLLCYFLLGKGIKPVEEELSIQVLPDFIERPVDKVKGRKFKVEAYIEDRTKIQRLLIKPQYRAKILQDFILPVGGEVVSGFGTIRQYGSKAEVALEGIEIALVSASGLEVNAVAEGKIIMAEKLPMLGNTVLLDHGFSFATLYCHMKNIGVKTGQEVLRGDRLGLVGNTGGAAKGKRLYYQLFVSGTPVDVQSYSKIDIFE